MRTVAVIAAGGRGKRAGGGLPKQFRSLAGKPVLAWTLALFQSIPAIDSIVVTAPRGHVIHCRDAIVKRYRFGKVAAVVSGGKERRDSVARAIDAIDDPCDLICIHDGARPLTDPRVIEKAIRTAARHGAAIAARPVADTVKRVEADRTIAATLDRSLLWAAATPQVFGASIIREAYARALAEGIDATDDAALVERLGYRVRVVEDGPENLKLTTEADFGIAAAILRARKAGR